MPPSNVQHLLRQRRADLFQWPAVRLDFSLAFGYYGGSLGNRSSIPTDVIIQVVWPG